MEFPGGIPVVFMVFAGLYWIGILGVIVFVVWTLHRMRLSLDEIVLTLKQERSS